jgi:hypothetical protein
LDFALVDGHDLLDSHVAGIHLYTLNRSDATRTMFDSLGVPRRRNKQILIACARLAVVTPRDSAS